MRIIFVRHGEPDYVHDCLTEEGKMQAEAAAERLASERISEIYASPCGRAMETASYTARRLNLTVNVLQYMHEISWGGEGIPSKGHPWTLGDQMLADGFDFSGSDWQEHPYFQKNTARKDYLLIADEIDGFLKDQGYVHENGRYFCEQANEHTIALFSHGGSGACVLAHLLNLPFPYVCSVLPYDFTSIIILNFPSREGEHVFPRLELFNDAAHIRKQTEHPTIQQISSDKISGKENRPTG